MMRTERSPPETIRMVRLSGNPPNELDPEKGREQLDVAPKDFSHMTYQRTDQVTKRSKK
jgi:hypothetical protein